MQPLLLTFHISCSSCFFSIQECSGWKSTPRKHRGSKFCFPQVMLFYRQFGNHLMTLTKKRTICFHCTGRAIMNDGVPFEANAACQVQLMIPKIPLKFLLLRRRGGGQKEVRRINSKPLHRHPSNNCRNSAQNIDRPSNSTPSTSFSSSRADILKFVLGNTYGLREKWNSRIPSLRNENKVCGHCSASTLV